MNLPALCRRMIFTQVLLGIIASCMAEKNPGLLLIAGALAAMSWYITEGPTGRFLPRWGVNAGALVASAWLAMDLLGNRSHVVSAMGHFTLALQILMLYARKSDREYSQLLVLSLLQMVSASVLSVSMIYGIFLAAYCVVALITLLLFHLTTAADRVHAANLHAQRGDPATGASTRPAAPVARPPGELSYVARRQLRSTIVVLGMVCGTVAAAVFVVMPRTGKSGIDFGPSAVSAAAQSGFTNTVRLGAGPIGTGSREPMLNLTIRSHGQTIGQEDEHWLVRGAALDHYNPLNFTWYRSNYATSADQTITLPQLNFLRRSEYASRRGFYTAEVALRDSRHRTLFSVVTPPNRYPTAGFDLVSFNADNLAEVLFSPLDQQLQTTESEVSATSYQIAWPILPRTALASDLLPEPTGDEPAGVNAAGTDGDAGRSSRRSRGPSVSRMARQALDLMRPGEPPSALPEPDETPRWRRRYRHYDPALQHYNEVTAQTYARQWVVELPRVRALAQQIMQTAGLQRDVEARHGPDDLRIAAALADHLRDNYRYDLQNPTPVDGRDPVIHFLFERRTGHCEVFAAGLTALCRSVGIPARMITGFRASEYNGLGGYYVVRQTNAHAWTEVYVGPDRGWMTLDATPPEEVSAEHETPAGLLATIRQAYEHVEFAWIRTVVAFDSRTQQSVLQEINRSIDTSMRAVESAADRAWAELLALPRRLHLSRTSLVFLGLSLVGFVLASFILVRLLLARRRRLTRLQLERLPADRRRSLGRELGFYLYMLDLLERHGHRRPAWQSPQHFALELSRRYPLRFDPVVALTELFYDVRFGQRHLDDTTRQRIRVHIKQLERTIADQAYSPTLPAGFHGTD